ncbi:hypothetical protein GCM10010372_47190 [Streptomyces tauricus]|uniref:Uncharacterized protein n=1 Tax=Streptomyces tauricus TaxID=68274 RepID=A0ABZ1JIV0_9ACTN|nr:hypothetical protein [Streptomyces tauricus]MCW8098540.1 hypothetical protein [Streptomyces tauricus]GHA41558.1 hypothetical protein GCM10010372_47190 [Streptomyces tauricus]
MGYGREREADMDDAQAWDERLSWAYGLISKDPAERAVALDHLASAREATAEAVAHFNSTLMALQEQGVEDPYDVPALRVAWEERLRIGSRSLPDGVWHRLDYEDIVEWPGLPYALLFLEWEARFPDEWTLAAKEWGTKEGLIRDLAVDSVGRNAVARAKLIDLVEIVVRRAYRCKDREYVRIARVVDGPPLRVRLEAARRSENPWARLHAGYVLWLLDRPEVPNSRRVWRTWLADAQQ